MCLVLSVSSAGGSGDLGFTRHPVEGAAGRGASCLRLFHAPVQAVAYLSLRKESSHLPTPANSKPSRWGQPCSLCTKGIEGLADLTFLCSQTFPVISSHAVRTQAEGLCSRLPKRWDRAVLCSSPTGPTSLGSKNFCVQYTQALV